MKNFLPPDFSLKDFLQKMASKKTPEASGEQVEMAQGPAPHDEPDILDDGTLKPRPFRMDDALNKANDFFKKLAAPAEKKTPLAKSFVLADLVPKALRNAFDFDIRVKESPRYFIGDVMEKAFAALDKATMLIIGVTWLVAVVALGVAFIAVKQAGDLKVKVETARALEPALPKINRTALGKEQYEPLAARLRKQFPTLAFEVTNRPTLRVSTLNGDDFMTWMNAVSYTDSMVPAIRWTLSFLCVGGECPEEKIMQAELTAEIINISQAQ